MSGSRREPRQPLLHDLTTVVHAPLSALSEHSGQIRAHGVQGVFYADCRVLSEAVLRVDGYEPEPVTQVLDGPHTARFTALARGSGNARPAGEGPLGLAEEIRLGTLRVDRVRQLTSDGLVEEIAISSGGDQTVPTVVTLTLGCDLAPMGEVRWGATGAALPARASGTGLVWANPGTEVRVDADSATAEPSPAQLTWSVDVPAGQVVTLRWRVRVATSAAAVTAPRGTVEWSRPEVDADDRRLVRLLTRSLDDLEALRLADEATPGDTFLGAGAPWYLTLFGRDSLWAARMMLPVGTRLAAGTLRTLARRQGSRVDPDSGEAPGKILHELRYGGLFAVRGGDEAVAYYGSIDATPLWISLLHDAWRWGMPEADVAALLPNLRAALDWLAGHADPDGDGFAEYLDQSGRGLANQGWKDSDDALRFRDGRQANGPIALCEVQGYVYQAAVHGAALLSAFDLPGADRWQRYADDLAERFRARFWVDGPDGPYPAFALDRDKRPVDALTSNIGHLLGTGLLSDDESAHVARALATPSMSGRYGLRTMATDNGGYDALSYHCGAIWPHDTAIAIRGLARAGFGATAARLAEGVLAAAEAFRYRMPELYSGDDWPSGPVAYPAACHPQAWSAAAGIAILEAALGLEPDVPAGELRLRPMMGAPLGAIDARGLRIAGTSVDVAVDRDGVVTVNGLPDTIRVVAPSVPHIPTQPAEKRSVAR
ncbi:MAG TPA: glycogen debranching N-terminal domain-containing protein [Micromonosporaceae bacterium]